MQWAIDAATDTERIATGSDNKAGCACSLHAGGLWLPRGVCLTPHGKLGAAITAAGRDISPHDLAHRSRSSSWQH